MSAPNLSLAHASLGWCARALAAEAVTEEIVRRLEALDFEVLGGISRAALRQAGRALLTAVAQSPDEADAWLAQVGQKLAEEKSLRELDARLGGTREDWPALLEAEAPDDRSVVVSARLMTWLRKKTTAAEPAVLEKLLALGWAESRRSERRVTFYQAYCRALREEVRRSVRPLEPVLLGARLEPEQWLRWLDQETGLPPGTAAPQWWQRLPPASLAVGAAIVLALAATVLVLLLRQPGRKAAAKPVVAAPMATPTPAAASDEPPPDPIEFAEALLEETKIARSAGRLEAADATARQAQELLEKLLPASDARLADALENLATHWEARDQWPEAARAHQNAVKAYEGTPAENTSPQLNAVNRLAGAFRRVGRRAEAEKLYRTLLRAYESAGPALEVDAATVAHNLANALVDGQRLAEARGFYERALALLADHWPTEENAQQLAGIMARNYQQCLFALGLSETEAQEHTRRLLKLPKAGE
jgi:tetratricopeptide (TPR) repeat protein